jgi:hypothetical protein
MGRIASATFGALLGLTASAQAEIVVNISKSEQRLAVVVDGAEIYRWPVSTGRSGLETPSGDFRPVRFERQWHSRKYDWSPMPWSIFFHRGYAVHGTMEARSLGRPASHGCVRLLPANASILFRLVRAQSKGDARIVVMNGPLPSKRDADPMAAVAAKEPVAKPDAAVDAKPDSEVAPMRRDAGEPPRVKVVRLADAPRAGPRILRVRGEDHFAAAGDDAAVRRGREAWLRSLDRKYGIAH